MPPSIAAVPMEDERYSEKRYVERGLFLTKLDSILQYFSFLTQPPPRQSIGFRKPQRDEST